MLAKMIEQLARELEMDSASLATQMPGVYEFPVDEDISAFISEIPYGFSITCTFAECPPKEKEEEFFTNALLANLYGQGTEGCILGLNDEAEKLILSRKVNYNIDYKEFRDIVEDFLNSVEFWQQEIKAYSGIKIA